MLARFLLSSIIACWTLFTATPTFAQPPCNEPGTIIHTALVPYFVWETAKIKHCKPIVCKAADDVYCTASAIFYYGQKMGTTYTDGVYETVMREYRAERRAFGVAHPERVPYYCRMLASSAALLGSDPSPGRWQDKEAWTIINELTLRADRGDGACLREVWAAIPTTETADAIVKTYRTCLDTPVQCLDWYDQPIPRRGRKQ